MAEYRGIDVSRHNGTIDWAKVKASGKVDFAIIRSGYGWTDGDVAEQRDKRFWENVKGCESNGIPYGIYHYSYCVKPENAKKEAEYFLRIIKGAKPTYPVWFDIEDPSQTKLSKETTTRIAADFCETVEKAGYYVGIYSYKNFLENNLDMNKLSKYAVWLAQIANAPTYGGSYGMWQYSWKGSVPGITGEVDLNVAYLDYPAAIRKNGLNGVNAPVQTDNKAELLKMVAEIKQQLSEITVKSEKLEELVKQIDS